MSATGFTKARSMGPVADAVARDGGSVRRVFQQAELPLRLIEQPEQLILLRDQFALVECAAREIGDDALPLRLSMAAGMASLGLFGRRVAAAPTLEEAIECCNRGIGSMLQSMTHLRLTQSRGVARWTYEISDPAARVGRRKNELLAFGYMADALRHFCGARAAPLRAELPWSPPGRARLEDMLGCDIAYGEKAALIFPAERLRSQNPSAPSDLEEACGELPDPEDLAAGVERLIALGLLDRRPTIDWVGRRLKLSNRTLQRRLAERGASFEALRRGVLVSRAVALLRGSDLPITQIAYDLGYSDPAHFTRAIAKWTGRAPSLWRRAEEPAAARIWRERA